MDNTPVNITVLNLASGMNTRDHPSAIQPDQAVNIENFDIRRAAMGEKRRGSTAIGGTIAGDPKCWGLGEYKPPGLNRELIGAFGDSFYRWQGSGLWEQLTTAVNGDISRVKFVQVRVAGTVPTANTYRLYGIQENADAMFYNGTTVAGVDSQIPRGRDTLFWLQRLWVIDNEGLLHASKFNDLTFSGLDIFKIGSGEAGQRIMRYLNQGILCIMEDSVHMVAVDQADVFSGVFDDSAIYEIHADDDNPFDCTSPASAIKVGSDVWFFGRKGLVSLIKTEQDKPQAFMVPVSDFIQDTIDRVNWAVAETFSACVWDNRYILSVALDGDTTPNHALVVDLRSRGWHVYKGLSAYAWRVAKIGTERRPYFGNALGNGKAYEAFVDGVEADDGVDIDSNIESARFDYGDERVTKSWDWLTVTVEQLDDADLEVEAQLNGGGYVPLGTIKTGGGLPKLPLTLPFDLTGDSLVKKQFDLYGLGVSHNIQFRFTANGAKRVKIVDMSLTTKPDVESFE